MSDGDEKCASRPVSLLRPDHRAVAGSRSELLPTLLRPADADEAAASIGNGASSAASKSQGSLAPCCMDALRALDAQCRVFQRSAEALGKLAEQKPCLKF